MVVVRGGGGIDKYLEILSSLKDSFSMVVHGYNIDGDSL